LTPHRNAQSVILQLTVQNINSREIGDIEINASPDDWVGTLLSVLPGVSQGDACFVGAALLDPAARIAGSPLLPGAVLSVGGAGPDYQPVRGAAAGTMHVIAGPDAGFGVALRPGRYFIGRAADAHVCLDDVDVSRTHALVEVSAAGGAVISDAGSRNGTWVNGTRVAGPTALEDGSVARLGQDTLRWAPGAVRTLRVLQTADGRLEFNRVAAAPSVIPAPEVTAPPRAPAARNWAALATSGLVGLVAGPAVLAATHHPVTLLASLAGPAAWCAAYAIGGHGRAKQRRAIAAARAAAGEQLAVFVAEEERVRHLLAPGPAEVTAMAAGARPDLWSREPGSADGLVLRVGVTDQAPSVRLRVTPGAVLDVPDLRSVPVTVDLRETGLLGVIGPGEPARALLRWLIVQLAALRSPDDLRIVLLTAGGEDRAADLAWVRWLPHLDGSGTADTRCLIGNTDASLAARIDELGKLILARVAERGGQARARPGAWFGGDLVVVLDGALALRNLPGMRDILRLGPAAGVYLLCADSQGMTEYRGVCELATGADATRADATRADSTAGGLRLIRGPGAEPVTGVPDGMDQARAEQVARALAPMRDRSPAAPTAIPYPVRLLGLLGLGVPSAQDILALWSGKREGPTTRVVLGADASGPVIVDLAAQGPHAALGGAAGAGKSALLRTLVTTLLLANRPDELNLVLIDGKGDGAFLPFEHCPHVAALIGSAGESAGDAFDEADAARVLASVRGEMSRRETILSRYGGDIDHYWRARELQPALPPLPRLVLVFDEFAQAAGSSPDFMRELADVVAGGRSPGLHLVLATGSPQRALSPELTSNFALRVSLRQDEAADSVAVLGVPDAVTIPRSPPGRGMIASMRDEPWAPRPFQCGYLGDPPTARRGSRLSVTPLAWADLGTARPTATAQASARAAARAGSSTDLDLIVAAIEEAARHIRTATRLP
jgi:DNA segregation ATPase FtsK/SpoIIIE, S-DNA-T family